MNPTRLATASLLLTGGVGLVIAGPVIAGPVKADPAPLGSYTFEAEDGEAATWNLTPCLEPADNCVQVSETGSSKRAPWTGTAYVTVGSWIMFVSQPDAILCDDGSSVPGVNNYSWSDDNLSGYVSINTAGVCGRPPESLAIPFQLTRSGAAVEFPDAPVYDAPIVPQEAQPPVTQETAPAPAEPLPAEAKPPTVEGFEEPLTPAEVGLPGFNR